MIGFADYHYLNNAEIDTFIRKSSELSHAIGVDKSVGSTIEKYRQTYFHQYQMHTGREIMAVRSVVKYLHIYQNENISDITRDDWGRPKVAILYGSGHERLLQSTLRIFGINVDAVTNLYPVHEYEQMDTEKEIHDRDRLRTKLAFQAIKQCVYAGELSGLAQSIDNSDENIAHLAENVASHDEKYLLQLLVMYAQLMKAWEDDDGQSMNRILLGMFSGSGNSKNN